MSDWVQYEFEQSYWEAVYGSHWMQLYVHKYAVIK